MMNDKYVENIQDVQEKLDYLNETKDFNPTNIGWLMRQVERAQELEGALEKKSLSVQTKDYIYMGPDDSVSYRLLQENKRFREALEFYADNRGYYRSSKTILTDKGEIARQALEVERRD